MYTEIFKFALISTIITTAAGVVMFFFAKEEATFQDLYNEALAEYKAKNYKKAIPIFEKAIKKREDAPQAYYNLGLTYFKLNELDLARDNFIKVLDFTPDDTDAIQNLGMVELQKENFIEALSFFKKAAESTNEDAECLFNIGYTLSKLGKDDEAIENIEKAMTINPENVEFKQFYVDILSKSPNLDIDADLQNKLLSSTLYLLDIYPSEERLIFLAGTAYSKLGEWENSIKYYERAIAINPKNVLALNQYALVLLCKGELSKAIESYEHSIEIDPNIPDTYLNMAFAYEKFGQPDSAKAMFEEFIKKFPDNPGVDIAKEYLAKNADDDEG